MMKDPQTWVSDPARLGAVLLASVIIYAAIVLLVKLFGKRTTANLNSFDWIITITLGSIASSAILLRDVAILDAVVVIATIGALQFALTKITRNSESASHAIKSEPVELLRFGELQPDAMQRERVSEAELFAELRGAGMTDPDQAAFVILETNGSLSTISLESFRNSSRHRAVQRFLPESYAAD